MRKILAIAAVLGIFAGAGASLPAATVRAEDAPKIADVYVIAGQSNGAGYTQISAQNDVEYENVLYWGVTNQTRTGGRSNEFYDFTPVRQGMGISESQIGPELGMAHYLNSLYESENATAFIIKSAAGGTSLLNRHEYGPDETSQSAKFGSWYPESRWDLDLWKGENFYRDEGLQYRFLINNLKTAVNRIRLAEYDEIRFKALCWMQGEADIGNEELYTDVFMSFCDDFRARLTEIFGYDCSDGTVVVGQISKTFYSYENLEKNTRFVEAQNALADAINDLYVVPSGDYVINSPTMTLGSDRYHWNQRDMETIGQLFGAQSYDPKADFAPQIMTERLVLNPTGQNFPSGTIRSDRNVINGATSLGAVITADPGSYLSAVYLLSDSNARTDVDFAETGEKDGVKYYSCSFAPLSGEFTLCAELSKSKQ